MPNALTDHDFQLLKAVKRRPGYTEEQVDNEAVLLRAYGKGTEVLIDREREPSQSNNVPLQTLTNKKERLHHTRSLPRTDSLHHCLQVFRMALSMDFSEVKCAIPKI